MRPLSPHLQIYGWSMTMAISIAHRLCGVGLYFCVGAFSFWLFTLVCLPSPWAHGVVLFTKTPFALFVLFFASWVLFHHMCGGIRHIALDLGYGFGIDAARKSGVFVLIGGILFNVLFWVWVGCLGNIL